MRSLVVTNHYPAPPPLHSILHFGSFSNRFTGGVVVCFPNLTTALRVPVTSSIASLSPWHIACNSVQIIIVLMAILGLVIYLKHFHKS